MSYHLTKTKNEQSYISLTLGATEKELGFTWFFGRGGKGELRYARACELDCGRLPRNAGSVTTEGQPANERGQYSFQLTIDGLEADTEYFYQLKNQDTLSRLYSFRTGGKSDFCFALAGDPQLDSHSDNGNLESWARTLDIIGSDPRFADTDFVISTGDQIEEYNDEDDYSAFLEHPEMSRFPFGYTIGNHETDSPLYHLHFNICNFSKYARTEAGTNNHFTYNGVLFVVLNTNIYDVEQHRAFIDEVLAANPSPKWRIALFHVSIFTAGKHGRQENLIALREKLAPVLSRAGFDLVLMGHDHIYCRTFLMDGLTPMTDPALYGGSDKNEIAARCGTLYLTLNSASGSKTYGITGDYGYTAFANQEHIPNISRVNVGCDRITVTTYRTTDMSVVDSFTLCKND